MLRDVILGAFENQPDIKVVGEAADLSIFEDTAFVPPQVILVGLEKPSSRRLELLLRLKVAAPDSKVVVANLLPNDYDLIKMAELGVQGFVMNDASTDELVSTVRSVASGAIVLPPALTNVLFAQIVSLTMTEIEVPMSTRIDRMTDREREIVTLISEGLSNKEIAHKLNIAIHTVKSHVHNILEKFALDSRIQVATQASKFGITPSRQSEIMRTM